MSRGRSVAMTRSACGALLVTVVAASWLHAASGDPGEIELGLFAGLAASDDRRLDLDHGSLWGARFGVFLTEHWSVEASGQRLSGRATGMEVDVDTVRMNGLFNFGTGGRLRPFVTAGVGRERLRAADVDEVDPTLQLGAGARWYVADRFGLRLDLRYSRAVDETRSSAEATVGLLVTLGGAPSDEDGDGVKDSKDQCPDTPAGALADIQGCAVDSDRDGVPDGLDRCPGTPRRWPVGEDGCPSDTDGDGVHDGIDRCPGTPRGVAIDTAGCPEDDSG